jgi:hypothetical protein
MPEEHQRESTTVCAYVSQSHPRTNPNASFRDWLPPSLKPNLTIGKNVVYYPISSFA